MLSPEELTKREAALSRDQQAWRNEKTDLVRFIDLHKAKKSSLASEVTKLEKQISDLTKRASILGHSNNSLASANNSLERKIERQSVLLDATIEDSLKFEDEVESRKVKIDIELEQYKADKIAEIQKDIDLLAEKRTAAITSLNDVKDKIETASSERVNTEKELVDYAKQVKETMADLDKQIAEIRDTLQPLRNELIKLSDEISSKQAIKNQLTEENVILITAKDKFKAYEKRAWHLLEAKDKELQERYATIREKEQMVPSRRSFLPSTDV